MSKAVIGLGFGDEGKGCTVDWLCNLSPASTVVRFSGGHQAGHNVVAKGLEHVFSNFGSGTIRGNPTYWDEHCTIDPVAIRREYTILRSKGISPRLYINRNCPVSTFLERSANRESIETMHHGTCGVGFFETLKRERNHFSLTAMDLKWNDVVEMKLKIFANQYYNVKIELDDHNEFIDAYRWLQTSNEVKIVESSAGIVGNDSIYESSQGLMLDENIGFFPHVTPSSVGTKRLREMGVSPQMFYVTRAYQTRHGNGPMTQHTYGEKDNIIVNPKETNYDCGAQGKFRRSMLDVNLLEYALRKDGGQRDDSVLVVTCLERLKEFMFYYSGKIITSSSKEEFVREIKTILDFKHAICCTNHNFKDL